MTVVIQSNHGRKRLHPPALHVDEIAETPVGEREVVVRDLEHVLARAGHLALRIREAARDGRRRMHAASVPRPSRRARSSSIDGGLMKTSMYPARSGFSGGRWWKTWWRTFAAPTTSMSRIIEWPAFSTSTIGWRSVP